MNIGRGLTEIDIWYVSAIIQNNRQKQIQVSALINFRLVSLSVYFNLLFQLSSAYSTPLHNTNTKPKQITYISGSLLNVH